MNKKIFIVIFCIYSLTQGRGIKDMLIEVAKTGDIEPVIAILNDASNEDKDNVLIIAQEPSVDFSDDDILIFASGLGLQDTVKKLLNEVNVNSRGNFLNNTPLQEAIINIRPEIVKILLSHPGIIIDKSDLELAKKKFLELDKNKGSEIEKKEIRQIGRMLINHLGLYTGQSRISKEGITVQDFPPELAKYIASFGNE